MLGFTKVKAILLQKFNETTKNITHKIKIKPLYEILKSLMDYKAGSNLVLDLKTTIFLFNHHHLPLDLGFCATLNAKQQNLSLFILYYDNRHLYISKATIDRYRVSSTKTSNHHFKINCIFLKNGYFMHNFGFR